jgi:Flp pilus assembly protein protease CpaA
MGFLSPFFLFGALAIAIPIVLHLLKREPENRVRFSAVHLLRRAPVEHSSRRRLRELLLLAMRVAALLLLAFAFARPFFTSDLAAIGSTTIVALDQSSSLSAPGQFARAQ